MRQYKTVELQCPYCGVVSHYIYDADNWFRPQIFLCDTEDAPGCDRYFAATISFKPVVRYFSMIDLSYD